MTDPWVSVIVPTYNGAAYVETALRSIEREAQGDLEVIAVDDCSTDSTLALLEGFSHRLPLRIFRRERVGNWVANTNFGLSVARGRYACFLHQDDQWLPGRLGVLRALAARAPDAVLFFHATQFLDAAGRNVGAWNCPLAAGRQPAGRLTERLLVQNFIATPAPLFLREAALRAGPMDESLWYTADWDYWLRLAATGSAVYHPAPLASFRVHALSQTAQGINRADELRRQIDLVLQRHLPPWEASNPGKGRVRRVARMSAEVNGALASWAHGLRPRWLSLLATFARLGPRGWYHFVQYSRIVERVRSRLRAGLAPQHLQPVAAYGRDCSSTGPGPHPPAADRPREPGPSLAASGRTSPDKVPGSPSADFGQITFQPTSPIPPWNHFQALSRG